MSAHIASARITAAHDGVAELTVTIAYDNGGSSEVTLDAYAGDALMRACNAQRLEDLTGHTWDKVRDALHSSYNRYQTQ